jgi:hypothetical protein
MAGILDIFGRLGQLYMAMEEGKQSRSQRLYTQQQAALEAARQQQKELQPLQEQVAGLAALARPAVQAAFPGATVTQLPTTGMNREQLTGIAGQLFSAAQPNVPQGMTIEGPGGLKFTPPPPTKPVEETPPEKAARIARDRVSTLRALMRSAEPGKWAPGLLEQLSEEQLLERAPANIKVTQTAAGDRAYTREDLTPVDIAKIANLDANTQQRLQIVAADLPGLDARLTAARTALIELQTDTGRKMQPAQVQKIEQEARQALLDADILKQYGSEDAKSKIALRNETIEGIHSIISYRDIMGSVAQQNADTNAGRLELAKDTFANLLVHQDFQERLAQYLARPDVRNANGTTDPMVAAGKFFATQVLAGQRSGYPVDSTQVATMALGSVGVQATPAAVEQLLSNFNQGFSGAVPTTAPTPDALPPGYLSPLR